jgi:hypothetical protein
VFLIEPASAQEMRALRALPARTPTAARSISSPERAIIAGGAPSWSPGRGRAGPCAAGVLQDVRSRSLPLTEALAATLRSSVDHLRDMLPLAAAGS